MERMKHNFIGKQNHFLIAQIQFWGLEIKFLENYFFLENYMYVNSEGAVSHKVLYYQQLSIGCYQVSFYANNFLWTITNSAPAFNKLIGKPNHFLNAHLFSPFSAEVILPYL